MTEQPTAATCCCRCGTAIVECACCDEPDCDAAICCHCLRVALGHMKAQPYAHGG